MGNRKLVCNTVLIAGGPGARDVLPGDLVKVCVFPLPKDDVPFEIEVVDARVLYRLQGKEGRSLFLAVDALGRAIWVPRCEMCGPPYRGIRMGR